MTALASIDPEALGVDAAAAAGAVVASLAPKLGVRTEWDGSDDSKRTGRLMPLVRRLCLYAQTGERTISADFDAAFATVANALLSSPARPWRPEDLASLAIGHGAPESDLLHVLGCVHARLKIERGEAVSVAELAALASITRQRAYQLARKGELVASGGRGATASTVTATEARRWLATRGLKGWG